MQSKKLQLVGEILNQFFFCTELWPRKATSQRQLSPAALPSELTVALHNTCRNPYGLFLTSIFCHTRRALIQSPNN